MFVWLRTDFPTKRVHPIPTQSDPIPTQSELTITNPFRYSFGFCHASTVGLHTGLHNVLILPRFGYTLCTLSLCK
jgi:hypothetical protein